MIYCGSIDINQDLYHFTLKNLVLGENTMIGSNAYRKKRLEIADEIAYYEEKMRIHPYSRKEARRNIEVLEDMLERLESKYHRQKSKLYMY